MIRYFLTAKNNNNYLFTYKVLKKSRVECLVINIQPLLLLLFFTSSIPNPNKAKSALTGSEGNMCLRLLVISNAVFMEVSLRNVSPNFLLCLKTCVSNGIIKSLPVQCPTIRNPQESFFLPSTSKTYTNAYMPKRYP